MTQEMREIVDGAEGGYHARQVKLDGIFTEFILLLTYSKKVSNHSNAHGGELAASEARPMK